MAEAQLAASKNMSNGDQTYDLLWANNHKLNSFAFNKKRQGWFVGISPRILSLHKHKILFYSSGWVYELDVSPSQGKNEISWTRFTTE